VFNVDPVHHTGAELTAGNKDSTSPDIADPLRGDEFNNTRFLVHTHNVSGLLSTLTLDFNTIASGLDSLLTGLENALKNGVFDKLPLVNESVKNDATQFVRDARARLNQFVTGVNTKAGIQQAVFHALGPQAQGGVGILGDLNSDGQITQADVQITADDLNKVEFKIRVTKDLSVNAPFDLGPDLAAIGLKASGAAQVDLLFDANLGFGVSKVDGFYFNTAQPFPELEIAVDVTTPGLNAAGELAFLKVRVEDNNGLTRLHGKFTLDVRDPSRDGKLTFSELTSTPDFGKLVDARLNAAHTSI
jgi:hypothetical protein